MKTSSTSPSVTPKPRSRKSRPKLSKCRDLILYDADMDLTSAFLEKDIERLLRLAKDTMSTAHSIRMKAGVILGKLEREPAFSPRVRDAVHLEDLASNLEKEYERRIRELKNSDETLNEGETQEEGQRRIEDENADVAEELDEALEAESTEQLSQLKKVRKAKRKAKLTRLYRELSKLTHPDSPESDEKTQQVFHLANKAYVEGNMSMLEALLEDVKAYRKAKRSNKFRKDLLEKSRDRARSEVREAQHALAQVKTSIGGQIVDIEQNHPREILHKAYSKVLDMRIDNAEDRLRLARMRLQSLEPTTFTWTGSTTSTTTSSW